MVNFDSVVQAAYQRAATHNPYLEDIKKEMLRYKAIEHKRGKGKCKCELCKQIAKESSAVRNIRVAQFHSWNTYAPMVQEQYKRRDNARYERKQLEEKFSTYLYPIQNEKT